jgi:hypothetical protein
VSDASDAGGSLPLSESEGNRPWAQSDAGDTRPLRQKGAAGIRLWVWSGVAGSLLPATPSGAEGSPLWEPTADESIPPLLLAPSGAVGNPLPAVPNDADDTLLWTALTPSGVGGSLPASGVGGNRPVLVSAAAAASPLWSGVVGSRRTLEDATWAVESPLSSAAVGILGETWAAGSPAN